MDPHNVPNSKIPFVTRTDWMTSVLLGILNLAIFALVVQYTAVAPFVCAALLAALYMAEITALFLLRSRHTDIASEDSVHALSHEHSFDVLRNVRYPVLLLDRFGVILWANHMALSLLSGTETPIGHFLSDFTDAETLDEDAEGTYHLTVHGYSFRAEGFCISEAGSGMYALMLTDDTEYAALLDRYNRESVAVAYIAIDNVEDILQYVHEKFADAVSVVDTRLKEWAASMDAVLKSYDNDKYLLFFNKEHLDRCLENRFAILDEIRDTRISDGFSITVSIGVSVSGATLAERERAARSAVDLALQRGGDQVVYQNGDSVEYYGGRTKSVYKRANVRSRTFTAQLTALITRAENVIIMGHRFGDFDSFGASVGLARLAMSCGVKTNVAVDMRDKNLLPCIRRMQESSAFSKIFVDNAEGLDLITPDTLLIIADVNTIERAQFADISRKVGSIVIVDHHRKAEQIPACVQLSYIEPSASSTCELVTEMLQYTFAGQNIGKEEADMLLSGILLDTKQFTRNTGTRTFAAAEYLRGAGADPTDVYELFKADPLDLKKEARFHTAITLYRDVIAIASCDGETDESYRVIASKAADKMLTLRQVEAAFTLVRIGANVHISGRSTGKINVQLILEKLHGGGHFDVAGAQVTSDSVISVLEMLKSAIDEYMEE